MAQYLAAQAELIAGRAQLHEKVAEISGLDRFVCERADDLVRWYRQIRPPKVLDEVSGDWHRGLVRVLTVGTAVNGKYISGLGSQSAILFARVALRIALARDPELAEALESAIGLNAVMGN